MNNIGFRTKQYFDHNVIQKILIQLSSNLYVRYTQMHSYWWDEHILRIDLHFMCKNDYIWVDFQHSIQSVCHFSISWELYEKGMNTKWNDIFRRKNFFIKFTFKTSIIDTVHTKLKRKSSRGKEKEKHENGKRSV